MRMSPTPSMSIPEARCSDRPRPWGRCAASRRCCSWSRRTGPAGTSRRCTSRTRRASRWRGLLMDVGRHLSRSRSIKRTLDGMAAVKLNVLHWHLSDDQGFRVESKRYPRLPGSGLRRPSTTRRTQIREVVAYARDRGIRVVPEFDMPGHATSLVRRLSRVRQRPGPYRHRADLGRLRPGLRSDPRSRSTGSSTASSARWRRSSPTPTGTSAATRSTARQWNAIAAHPGASCRRTASRTTRRCRPTSTGGSRDPRRSTASGWSAGTRSCIPTCPTTAVIQSWRGPEYARPTPPAPGYRGILSAPYYLDHIDAAEQSLPGRSAARPSAASPPEQAARVLGGEACMWGEHVGPETIDSPDLAAARGGGGAALVPAPVTDVDDMYRRLTVTSVGLEQVGTTQGTHAASEWRGGWRRRPIYRWWAACSSWCSRSTSASGSGCRAPPSSRRWCGWSTRPAPTRRPEGAGARWPNGSRPIRTPPGLAADSLRVAFGQWQLFLPAIERAAGRSPLVADGLPAAQALGDLGRVGPGCAGSADARSAAGQRLDGGGAGATRLGAGSRRGCCGSWWWMRWGCWLRPSAISRKP